MATVSLVDLLEHEILPRLTPEQVYPEVTFLHRSERAWRGSCPMHGGADANFVVNPKYLTWTCYSHCGHGSAVSYLNGGEPARGRDFVEIVRRLADLVGVSFPDRARTPEAIEQANRRERRQRLLGSFLALASRSLLEPRGSLAREYLASRGLPIDFDLLTSLDLGLYPSDLTPLIGLGFSRDEIATVGLADRGWHHRLIGAWRDRYGGIATLFGRAIAETMVPKYLYLRGAPRPLLYGLPRFGSAGARAWNVVVVEGIFDAIRLRLNDFESVGAIGSNSLSIERLGALEAIGIRELTLVPDADEAGRIGAIRTAQAWRQGTGRLRLSIVPATFMAPLKDPDEFVRARGIEEFRQGLDAALPANIYVASEIVSHVSPYSPMHIRRQVISQLGELIADLKPPRDVLDVEDIIRLAASKTDYSIASLKMYLGVEANVDGLGPGGIPVDNSGTTTRPMEDSSGDADASRWSSTATWHPLLRALLGDVVPPGSRPATEARMWAVVDEMGIRTDRRRSQLLSLRYGRTGPALSLREVAPFLERLGPGEGPLSLSRVQQLEVKSLSRLRVRRYAEQVVRWETDADFENWKLRRRADVRERRTRVAPRPTVEGPKRVGQPWSLEEESRLHAALDRGESVAAIARAHGRMPGGIRSRLLKLGRLDSDGDG